MRQGTRPTLSQRFSGTAAPRVCTGAKRPCVILCNLRLQNASECVNASHTNLWWKTALNSIKTLALRLASSLHTLKDTPMQKSFRLGESIYYVPKHDARLARYVPITRLRLSLTPPILVLGHHLVISPKLWKNGNIARDWVGSYWVSKEAYEAYRAIGQQSLWCRMRLFLKHYSSELRTTWKVPGIKVRALQQLSIRRSHNHD